MAKTAKTLTRKEKVKKLVKQVEKLKDKLVRKGWTKRDFAKALGKCFGVNLVLPPPRY